MATRLKYQTGIVTLIQFLVGTTLGFANQILSIISGCTGKTSVNCVSNSISSLSLIIVTAIWFAFIAAIGYAAQDRRSRGLARILILAELGIAGVAGLDLRHSPNILSMITSALDLALALWALVLAFRLARANGGRIVTKKSKPRQRRRTL